VTAIVSDEGSSQNFIASFADGEIKVFDRRMEEENVAVRSYSDHTSWVQNVRWHPKLSGQFLSAR
jgi:regulator-associated protein of mTOR